MQKVAWVIVGLLIGMLVATMVPAGAHHRHSVNRLEDRIYDLEQKTRHIDSYGYFDAGYIDVPTLCGNDPAVWDISYGLEC